LKRVILYWMFSMSFFSFSIILQIPRSVGLPLPLKRQLKEVSSM